LAFLSFSWLAVRPGDLLFQSIPAVFIHMAMMAVAIIGAVAAAVVFALQDKPRKVTAKFRVLAMA